MDENSSCITIDNFKKVVGKIIIFSSNIKIKNGNDEYQVFYVKDKNEFVFKQSNYSIGKITSNLDIITLAKRYEDSNNQRSIINEIFCDLFDWSQGKLNILID